MNNNIFDIDANGVLVDYLGHDSQIVFSPQIKYMLQGILDYKSNSLTKIHLNKEFIGCVYQESSVDSTYLDKFPHCFIAPKPAKKLESYSVDEDNLYFASFNNALYSKDFKVLYATPYIRESTLKLHADVEILFKDSIELNDNLKNIILSKMTTFYVNEREMPFYQIRDFEYSIYSENIDKISMKNRVKQCPPLNHAKLVFTQYDLDKCTSSFFIKDRLALGFMENQDLYSKELQTKYLKYIEKRFIQLYLLAYTFHDNKKFFSFFKEHNMTLNKDLFVASKKELSLYLEVLILQKDKKSLDYFLLHNTHDLFTTRAFLIAIRYASKDFLASLVNANYKLNLKAFTNTLDSKEICSIHTPFCSVDSAQDNIKHYASSFNCISSLSFSNVLLMLIKESLKWRFNTDRIDFQEYAQTSYSELVGQKVNTDEALLDNLKFLIENKAISDDLIAHLYFYSIFYDRKSFRQYFESIKVGILDIDLKNFFMSLSLNLDTFLENIEPHARKKFIDNLDFLIEKAKEQNVSLVLNQSISYFIYLYARDKVISRLGINLGYENDIKKIFADDYLLKIAKSCSFLVDKNNKTNFYKHLILSKKYDLTNYILDNHKVPFKDEDEERAFFESLIDLAKKEQELDILPFIMQRLSTLQNKDRANTLTL